MRWIWPFFQLKIPMSVKCVGGKILKIHFHSFRVPVQGQGVTWKRLVICRLNDAAAGPSALILNNHEAPFILFSLWLFLREPIIRCGTDLGPFGRWSHDNQWTWCFLQVSSSLRTDSGEREREINWFLRSAQRSYSSNSLTFGWFSQNHGPLIFFTRVVNWNRGPIVLIWSLFLGEMHFLPWCGLCTWISIDSKSNFISVSKVSMNELQQIFLEISPEFTLMTLNDLIGSKNHADDKSRTQSPFITTNTVHRGTPNFERRQEHFIFVFLRENVDSTKKWTR